MKKTLIAAGLLVLSPLASAADYIVDVKGAHAFINFKIKHLGYSWLTGRFNTFDGAFNYDASKPEASKITINIDPSSIDSNHAERDKHLRDKDFLYTDEFKTAKFVSTKVVAEDDGDLQVHGDLTLRGVTKPIVLDVEKIGEGKDPWGGYRVGFSGTTTLSLKDYGIRTLGSSTHVDMELHIEGIRQ